MKYQILDGADTAPPTGEMVSELRRLLGRKIVRRCKHGFARLTFTYVLDAVPVRDELGRMNYHGYCQCGGEFPIVIADDVVIEWINRGWAHYEPVIIEGSAV